MRNASVVMLLAGMIVVALLTGCQTGPKGPSDNDLVKATVDNWKSLVPQKNLDAVMALYSPSFESPEYGGKSGIRDFIKDAMDMGYLDGAEAKTDMAQTKIENGVAKVYPIDLSASFGSATIELTLVKDKAAGQFLITGMRVEMH